MNLTTAETTSSSTLNGTEGNTEPEREGLDDVNIILSVLIGLVGVVGNAGVLIVLGSSRQMRRKLVNICLMNQSAIDLAASLLLIVNGTQDPNVKVKLTGKFKSSHYVISHQRHFNMKKNFTYIYIYIYNTIWRNGDILEQ